MFYCCHSWALSLGDVSMVGGVVRVGKGRVAVGLNGGPFDLGDSSAGSKPGVRRQGRYESGFMAWARGRSPVQGVRVVISEGNHKSCPYGITWLRV